MQAAAAAAKRVLGAEYNSGTLTVTNTNRSDNNKTIIPSRERAVQSGLSNTGRASSELHHYHPHPTQIAGNYSAISAVGRCLSWLCQYCGFPLVTGWSSRSNPGRAAATTGAFPRQSLLYTAARLPRLSCTNHNRPGQDPDCRASPAGKGGQSQSGPSQGASQGTVVWLLTSTGVVERVPQYRPPAAAGTTATSHCSSERVAAGAPHFRVLLRPVVALDT